MNIKPSKQLSSVFHMCANNRPPLLVALRTLLSACASGSGGRRHTRSRRAGKSAVVRLRESPDLVRANRAPIGPCL